MAGLRLGLPRTGAARSGAAGDDPFTRDTGTGTGDGGIRSAGENGNRGTGDSGTMGTGDAERRRAEVACLAAAS